MATLIGTSSNEILAGTSGGDTISDGAGNDYVIGGAGNDTVTGGAGNDWYEAGSGTNTLNLSSGFGNDIIDVFTNHGGPPYTDVLNFTSIFSENLFAYRVGDSYGLSVLGGADTVAVPDFFSVSPAPFGSSSVPLQAGGTDTSTPTTDSDGNGIPDIQEIPYLRFGTGVNDTINVANVGNHTNTVWGGLDNDTITGSTSFAMLFGNGGNDTLTTGSSATYSYLAGGSGDDTYSVPTGRAAFIADFGSSASDTLSASGISTLSATLEVATIDNRHLWVYEPSNGTQFLILDWTTSADKIETYQLGNGTFTFAQIQTLVSTAGVPNMTWEAWSGNTTTTAEANAALARVQTLAGNDSGPTLSLVIGGTNGNDSTVYGFSSNDTLIGDVGSDNLIGYGGNDQYVFRPGDGFDFIDNDIGASLGETNYLRFGAGVRAGQFSALQNGDSLQLKYGASDQVTIYNWYFGGTTGTIARQMQIGTSDAPVMPLLGTGTAGGAAAEMLVGTTAAESVSAAGGDDWITAAGGNDTVDGGSGKDTAAFAGPRTSYLISYSGTSVVVTDIDGAANGGNDGTDTLNGIERLSFSDATIPSNQQASDLNGDRSADYLWQNSSGAFAQWNVSGSTINSPSFLPAPSSDWVLQTTADFNADGRADYLWRNSVSGSFAEWYVDNASLISGSPWLPTPSSDWTFLGNADFNGDGRADFLWRNTNTGNLAEWFVDSASLISTSPYLPGPSSDWSFVGNGDFNGDGRADFLWQNASLNVLAEWNVDSAYNITASPYIVAPSSDWAFKSIADLNGDGKSDLLWQNSVSGALAPWYMDGGAVANNSTLLPGPSPDWQLKSVADFNGDGKADYLWRNTNSGALSTWQVDPATSAITTTPFLPAPSSDWALKTTLIPGQIFG